MSSKNLTKDMCFSMRKSKEKEKIPKINKFEIKFEIMVRKSPGRQGAKLLICLISTQAQEFSHNKFYLDISLYV